MDDHGRCDDDPQHDQPHPHVARSTIKPIMVAVGDNNTLIAGDNTAAITTGLHDPLDGYRGDEFFGSPDAEAQTFVGREQLFRDVDLFLSGHPSGYFLIAAKAGLGKTAFVLELARTRGYHRHIVEPGDTAVMVRKHLAVGLIDRFHLGGFGPSLPASAGRSAWFESVLTAAARRRDLDAPGQPIVLVIDGVDEMRATDPEPRMGLPRRLPDNVYILITCRDGSPLIDQWGSVPTASIVADSAENLWDMRQMLEHAVHQPALNRVITDAGISHDAVIETLLDRCAGVWIYLRFVLSDIATGQRPLHSLHELPNNLWDYYASNLERWRRDTAFWHRVGLPVLAVLAAGGAEMTATMIAAITRAGPTSMIAAFLDGPLQAFCHAERAPGGDRYRLYHGSLRHFLSGLTDSTYRVAGDWHQNTAADNSPLRRQLRAAVRRAHLDVIAYFTRRWGALHDGFPGLADQAGYDPDDAYGLAHLVWHLQQTRRSDDIHLLLSGRGLHDDSLRQPHLVAVWLRAHQRAGTTDSYSENLSWAWQDAVHWMNRPGRFSVPAAVLAIRYAILSASLNSIAAALTPAVVAALVLGRIWPLKKALAHARRITDPMNRAETLLRLIRVCPGPERAKIVKATFDALMLAGDNPQRSLRLSSLVPFLPPHLVVAAIPAACQISVPSDRIKVLVRLLSTLDEPARTAAARKLLRDANRSTQLDHMMVLLNAAARFLPIEYARVCGYRMQATGAGHGYGPTTMALALSDRLDPASHDEIAREAVRRICTVADPVQACQMLGQVACFLPPNAVAEIHANARRLEQSVEWPDVIRQLAVHAAHSGATILALVRHRPGSAEWQAAIDAFAADLDERQLADLVAIAQTARPESRMAAILPLVPYLSPAPRRQLMHSPAASTISKMDRILLQGISRTTEDTTTDHERLRAEFDDATSIRDRYETDTALRQLAHVAEEPAQHRLTSADPARDIERLTVAMASASRPTALKTLLKDPGLLSGALGDEGVGTIRRDIREVCDLLT